MENTGKHRERRYIGEAVDITYDNKRCIHAEQCVQQLATVFKKHDRPWVDANGASAQEIINAVTGCPSGALHAESKNDPSLEESPQRNTLLPWKDGPLQFGGRLEIKGATIDLSNETRVTLCRCGASDNKPFCDNTHRAGGFEAPDRLDPALTAAKDATGIVTISPEPNGPYHILGAIEILNAAGEVIFAGQETSLCRCGHSADKPFCDGTHEAIGFQAE